MSLAAGAAPAWSTTLATTVWCVARSTSTSRGPLHAGNYGNWSVDRRSALLRSSAATDLVAMILVVSDPIALVEVAVEDVQGAIVIVPELLPAFFIFAAVVAYFVGAGPESILGSIAARVAGSAATGARAAEISLGKIAGQQQGQTGQQDEHGLSHGHSLSLVGLADGSALTPIPWRLSWRSVHDYCQAF